ncbi:hypothetical protein SDRG_00855 [Saprolegnia diclina VS20]|uniref:LysM domain-containing protein n=1 Tax=Saprolegnia diclina (strain VS20) TaxID=1156394 RepID=T0QUY9_SAPDV|nr:hypothetical protein SDRG_00855 [Saprolegnia diclina VS20]EQC42009.1 hypothetical protein SDRG_00855 [Saprolegnia diclina VS20]|eukprot:XP_008604578.1 hypothetical protein SDRG_00855 [Saprolegnia diclina VS20]
MYGTWGNKKQAAESAAPFRYSVMKGDTLSSIAAKTNMAEKKIRELNPIVFSGKSNNVYPGQELIVDEPLAVSLPPPPEFIDQGWGQMHVVRSGDTVKSIALEFNTTEEAIRNDNRQYFPKGERGIMFPGQMLHIRVINTIPDPNHVDAHAIMHVVTHNDTFDAICAQHKTTKARLLLKNKGAFPNGMKPRLVPGQALVVGHNSAAEDRMRHIGEVKLTKQIHIVQVGETPESVAAHYGMTIDELREFNRAYFPKGYRGEIRPNHKLVVKRVDNQADEDGRNEVQDSDDDDNAAAVPNTYDTIMSPVRKPRKTKKASRQTNQQSDSDSA